MKIAVINFSGNVGKSTIAKHLLAPRLSSAAFISVESINSDEGDGAVIRGKQFGQLQEQMLLLDSAIIDIGASNVEDFIKLMQSYRGSHEDFDHFIIPTVKDGKQLKDTIATIQVLSEMQVPADKISVIFNKLETDEAVEDTFYPIFSFHKDSKSFRLSKRACLQYNELYQKLRLHKLTIPELLEDKTDYKAILRISTDKDEKLRAVNMITMQRLAVSANENLDQVYKTIVH